jgi:hypothetical protein
LWYDELSNRFHDRVNHERRREFLTNKKSEMSVDTQLQSKDRPFTPLPTEEERHYYQAVNALN